MSIKTNIRSDKTIIVASESPNLFSTKRLLEEAMLLGIKASHLNPFQSMMAFGNSPKDKDKKSKITGVYFHRTTGVRYDDFDLTFALNMEIRGHKIINSIKSIAQFRSKDLQQLFFQRNDLSCIKSIAYRGELDKENFEKILLLSKNDKYILKMLRGNQGIGVNLINGAHSLKSLLETFSKMNDQKFLIQPYIEHSKEWRLFFIKNELVAIIEKKMSSSDFRGNAQRSNGKLISKLPKSISDEIQRGVCLSGLMYCGVDLFIKNDQYYILEFNPIPGFQQVEELSKLNIAKELIISSC